MTTTHLHLPRRSQPLWAACVVLIVELLGPAGPATSTAHADPADADADAKFLAALSSRGITYLRRSLSTPLMHQHRVGQCCRRETLI